MSFEFLPSKGRDLLRPPLRARDLHPDPFEQLRRWLGEALDSDLHQPTAMAVATATPDGTPSLRMVLLKLVQDPTEAPPDGGLVFFTDLASRKATELTENPRAALLLYWDRPGRQVRIEGRAEAVERELVEAYFRTRPRASQLMAHASVQSAVVSGRVEIEARLRAAEQRFAGRDVPCPDDWGGFRVRPDTFEFWQGRQGRAHDRFRYRRADERWWIERLSP